MAQVNVYQFAEVQMGDGNVVTIGSKATPKTISLTGVGTFSRNSWVGVSTATEVLRVGSSAGDDLSGFVFLAIKCSVDAQVSWVGTLNSTTDSDTSSIGVEAGTWLFLSSDQTTEHGGDPVATRVGNTAQTITYVYVEPSASGNIEVIALK